MKQITLSLFWLIFALTGVAQEDSRMSCTSIMVGRKATTDGSVITSHTCDSWYRTWMNIVASQDFSNDTTTTVYEGLMHTEHVTDMTNVKEKGKVPQARHTYRFLNTAYPCLNEKQLGMGETTIGGRDTLQNKKGMFMIEELARIALQRCTTARDAIRLMGELVKEYGYGDSGECLTIGDPNEVWIFEVFGEGPDQVGGVWCAQRIPDDMVAISANISRIGKIDLQDTDHFMASENIYDVARRLNLWDGEEEFCFWKVYSGGNYFNEPKNYSVRELYLMQQLAPNAGFNNEMSELPLCFKPEKLVSAQDVAHLLGSYYEGTDLNLSGRLKIPNARKNQDAQAPDSVVSPVANPWIRPDEIALYKALGDSAMNNIRTVSVSWCAYSTVIQLRNWLPDEIGGVAWICLDNPGQSPRFPIFSGTTELPMMLGVCGQHRQRHDAALWHYRQANRIASNRWGIARKTMEPAQQYFLDKGARELPFVEQTWKGLEPVEARNFLNGYTADFFASTIVKWDDLEKTYWRQFWAGF